MSLKKERVLIVSKLGTPLTWVSPQQLGSFYKSKSTSSFTFSFSKIAKSGSLF